MVWWYPTTNCTSSITVSSVVIDNPNALLFSRPVLTPCDMPLVVEVANFSFLSVLEFHFEMTAS